MFRTSKTDTVAALSAQIAHLNALHRGEVRSPRNWHLAVKPLMAFLTIAAVLAVIANPQLINPHAAALSLQQISQVLFGTVILSYIIALGANLTSLCLTSSVLPEDFSYLMRPDTGRFDWHSLGFGFLVSSIIAATVLTGLFDGSFLGNTDQSRSELLILIGMIISGISFVVGFVTLFLRMVAECIFDCFWES